MSIIVAGLIAGREDRVIRPVERADSLDDVRQLTTERGRLATAPFSTSALSELEAHSGVDDASLQRGPHVRGPAALR